MRSSGTAGRVLAAAAAATALVALRPHPGAAVTAVRDRPGDLDAVVAPVAGGLLWLLAAWVLLALAVGAAARLPGAAGRLGRTLTTLIVPRAWRGILVGSLATGLVVGPAAASFAAVPNPSPGPSLSAAAPAWPTGGATTTPTPAPGWPSGSPTATPTATPTGTATATPTGTATAAAPTPTPTSTPPTATPTRTPEPRTPAPPSGPPPDTPASPADRVTVAPGDSLWSVVTAQLTAATGHAPTGHDVAVTWPRWYAANRAVIGDDPNLVHPGAVLQAPATPASPGGPA